MLKIKHSTFDNYESESLLKSISLETNGSKKTRQEIIYGRILSILLFLGILFVTYFLYCVTLSRQSQPNITINISGDQLIIENEVLKQEPANTTQVTVSLVPDKYLINGPKCKLPSINPFGTDVMQLFQAQIPRLCSSKPPLTYINQNWNNDTVVLHLNNSLIESYVTNKNESTLECCYQEIIRVNESDDNINLTLCRPFDRSVQLPPESEFILVKCAENGKDIYINGHALVRKKDEVSARFKEVDTTEDDNQTKPLSVLLIGIDSISRLNFIRSMPNTAKYLHDTDWMELEGYNKMGDNTFPNIMAILTGFNSTLSYRECSPTKIGKLDACPMVWYTFREQGYATAYAEDEIAINTFNYHKTGFVKPPVDHYFRPFGIAAEKYFNKRKMYGLDICLGYQTYADHIYQYAIDFATQYKGNPYFGLFWTSSFSHNDISSASCMDDYMKNYIVKLSDRGILNETLVVFFSDHGIRFGDVRKLLTGWYEERLPFVFFSLPKWFKQKYSKYVQNLDINKNRLTTPYDFHVTLKHILSLSGTNISLVAPSCPMCQSLFEEIPYDRSCDDANIIEHWCTCIPYEKFDESSSEIKESVNFVIKVINDDLEAYKIKHGVKLKNSTTIYTNNCAKLQVTKILSAYLGKSSSNSTTYHLVTFEASPGGGEFEATVKYNEHKVRQLSGSISRLNMYAHQADCIDDGSMKNYCYCEI